MRLHACTQDVSNNITPWLSNNGAFSTFLQHFLLLLALPLLYFMLRPLTAGEDLYFMAIPMFSFCDDLHNHIVCNANVLKHVKEYFRISFEMTRRTLPDAAGLNQPGYWHMIPTVMSGIVLCFGTLVELIISTSCATIMIAALIATSLLAPDWRLPMVDWLDEGILQEYRRVEEAVEWTFLNSGFWAGLWVTDAVIFAVNGRGSDAGAGRNEVEEMEQAARVRTME